MGNCFGLSSFPDEPKQSAITPSFSSSGISGPSSGITTATTTRGGFGFSESSSSAGNSRFSVAASEYIDERDPNGEILEAPNMRTFSYSELKSATKGFKIDTVLGEGGFGKVYKGWIDDKLKTGSKAVVAIKKLNSQSLQGFEQWQSEINFLGSLSHPNLVRLIGYCWEDKELLLVYEYMAKGSLENHLFRKSAEPLAWERRISIALGAARGLAFLHNLDNQIIYRDFKASNILLDGNYCPKLSDFGLAKFGPSGDNSHVTTRVMGTFGYAAPEYVATGHLYVKSDVYGFGVVLLELLTGLRAIDPNRANGQKSLVDWARPSLSSKKKVSSVMDGRLKGQYLLRGALEAAQLTGKCLRQDPRGRPSMKEVVDALHQIDAMNKERMMIIKDIRTSSSKSSDRGSARLPSQSHPSGTDLG
ncbi:hypothetical protein V2J09_002279 [Rumex salicifolius]